MSFFDYPIYDPAQDHITRNGSASDAPISIFVNAGDYEADQKGLLSKIIHATGNSIDTIHVQQIPIEQTIALHEHWGSETGLNIIFGIKPERLMLQSETYPYVLIHFNNRTLLFADSLTALSADGDKKKALWGALKTYFDI